MQFSRSILQTFGLSYFQSGNSCGEAKQAEQNETKNNCRQLKYSENQKHDQNIALVVKKFKKNQVLRAKFLYPTLVIAFEQ